MIRLQVGGILRFRGAIMSGLPLLSAELPDALFEDPSAKAARLRPAHAADAPVSSPVHALQHEIAAGWNAEAPGDSHPAKAPGWVRLAFPVCSSLILWFGIIGFVRSLM
ncbi:hypothetical protein [Novosphingobium jiangmenense]|uniref:Uncharacterized protein n=1 Tax=Novosphingobium jiangmenense TaxID=2791981 RepID=A0ABS0HIM9_9SPHN|nr:hypothetical protein [Novosphingobium jiangmenense]MBF9151880.1 hypothetical protein [Novosphingobium jiangmenense]